MGLLDGKTITDALYGDSYDPLINRIYKGEDLIFERNSWLYEIHNIQCVGSGTAVSIFQPENENYLGYILNPYNADNFNRGFEFLINANTTAGITGEDGTTIGIIGSRSSSGTHSAFELGVRHTGVYVYTRGSWSLNPNQVYECDCQGTDIHVIRQPNSQTLTVYLGNVSDNNVIVSTTYNGAGSEDNCRVNAGYWYGGRGTYYFNGTINYYKFKWIDE